MNTDILEKKINPLTVEQVKQAMTGPVASISTPFNQDGSIDYRGLRNQVDFIIDAGSGVVLLTYGDSLYSILTDREIAEVTKVVVEQTENRALIVAATGIWWTGECIQFARFAKELGADILMSLPPHWTSSYTVTTLKEHYAAISREMPTMIVTRLGMKPIPLQVISELINEEHAIVAIKDDICGSYGRAMATTVDGRWAVLSGGLKENHLDVLPYGADGYLSVYMRFKPEISHQYWNALQKGNLQIAVNIINRYEMPFFNELIARTELNFDALIHASMEIFDICGRWRRPPYANANNEQMDVVKQFFRERSLY